jgi:NAD(P)-binding Rossmann-like domain
MTERTLNADYVIVGSGAVAMAFADTLLTDTEASIVMVDRRHKPGGHWNDSYPFVRLHGPSINYGVNSRPLGTGRVDQVGLNKGLHELAGVAIAMCYTFCSKSGNVPRQKLAWYRASSSIQSLPAGWI